jgi:hypothetical protein
MGAVADAVAAYVQPLLDETDRSLEQMNKAFAIGQLCWNLALVPEEERDDALGRLRASLNMDDGEFEAFRRSVVIPMIRRHQEMFPRMHQLGSIRPSERRAASPKGPTRSALKERYPGTARNAPCPCNSGSKYKR